MSHGYEWFFEYDFVDIDDGFDFDFDGGYDEFNVGDYEVSDIYDEYR